MMNLINNIFNLNLKIQLSNFPQNTKDEAMKITNETFDYCVNATSPKYINVLILEEIRKQNYAKIL